MRVGVVGHVEWVQFVSVEHLPRAGEVVHAAGSFTRAAGGGAVAAAVLAELGAEVHFFSALGRDADGSAAQEQLRRRGVALEVAWRERPTRRAVTMLEDGGERTIVTIAARLEPRGRDALEWTRLRDAAGVYFTAGDGAALARAREARVVVASPRARAALHEFPAPIDALVFSAHDRDELEWARAVGDRASLLVATDGASGGRWWGTSEGRWEAHRVSAPVKDSYGCGDSFAAGFTFALAAGKPVAEAAALGAECGARCLSRAGAP